jgi:polysaccharide biosynthesis/export protein ExoF
MMNGMRNGIWHFEMNFSANLFAAVVSFGLAGCLAFASGAQAGTQYLLGAGDKLLFDFLDDTDTPVPLEIATDGTIQLPIIGSFSVVDLTIDEAHGKIDTEYVKREVLVEPKLALSVQAYRAVFVLGDVKSAGSVLFHPFMTVEQAIGLAGGSITSFTSAEDRTMTRVKMEGDLGINTVDLTKATLTSARLNAQLDGRVIIEERDIPEMAKSHLDMTTFLALKESEERLLKLESGTQESEMLLVDGNLEEAKKQIELLQKLVANQRKSIKYSEEASKRAAELLAKGLKTAGDAEDAQRQLTSDEGRLLSTLAEISQSTRGISTLMRERAQLETNLKTKALRDLQDQLAVISRAVVARKSIETQLLISSNLSLAATENQSAPTIALTLRRREKGRIIALSASAETEIHPGDTLTVSVSSGADQPPVAPASSNSAAAITP